MKNAAFLLLNEKERHEKLKAVLNTKTQGKLTDVELKGLLHILPTGRQYEIVVYQEMEAFCREISRVRGNRKRLVLGAAFVGIRNREGETVCEAAAYPEGAISVWEQETMESAGRIHIFVPPERYGKEGAHE